MAQTLELSTDGSVARTPGPDPLIGKELLHYRVVEVIGQGGMSVVYRGHDAHLHRDVAIKVLHPFLAEKAECRARLAREARAVARLEHPHILKVFDFSGDPPTIDEKPDGSRVRGFAEGFIVAELVRGATLKRFAEQHELWKVPEVGAMVVWQMAKALEHAHAHGVVHRDLKPENIMVRDDGWLKLMDFGIAHIADQKGLTVTGTLLGSPAHMAPECIDGHAADERSDLFSLGTVLYWLCTGHLPFEALTPHALLKQIVEGRAIPVQQRSPRVSDDLARVVGKAMATKPTERYQTAGAFVTALEELLDKSGMHPAPDRLRATLNAPDTELLVASRCVREAHLKRAEQYIADRSPVRALACLSRVLADDNQDADARALLERAQGEIETTEPRADPEASESARNDALVTPLDDPNLTGTVPGVRRVVEPEPRTFGRAARQVGVVAAAAALITSAVVIATRLDDASARDKVVDEGTSVGTTDDKADDKADVELGAPAVDRDDRVARDERDARGDKREDDRRADDKRVDKRIGKVGPPDVPRVTPPKGDDVVAPADAVTKRSVTLIIKPWADVFVDGAKIAEFKKRMALELPLGPHTVVFKNPNAKDREVKLTVTEAGALPDVMVELEPQPAYLVVNCNVPDASVSVGEQGPRPAGETRAVPYVVTLKQGESKAKLEVTVFKPGYAAFVRKVDFTAGQKLPPLDVVLEPVANEGAPSQ